MDTEPARQNPRSQVPLPDGRTLAGASYGPERGRAILFVAGAGTGRAMLFGDGELSAANARLITMDRPGMGASTAYADRTITTTAADYAAFLDGIGVGTPIPVVANSQGAPFGLALALLGHAARLVLASPADEVAHPDVAALLPEHARELARLAGEAPERAERVLSEISAEAMERMVVDGADERSRAVYEEPEFRARYRQALAEGFAGDGAAYVRDTLLAMRPWNLDLASIEVPVSVLFGASDVVHSPDLGAILTGRIPGATRRIIADAGGALLWTHSADVLRDALKIG